MTRQCPVLNWQLQWVAGERLKNAPRTARAPWRTAHEIPSAGSASACHGLRWFDTFGAASCARARIRRGAFNKAARGRRTSLWTRKSRILPGEVELSKSCLFPLPSPPLDHPGRPSWPWKCAHVRSTAMPRGRVRVLRGGIGGSLKCDLCVLSVPAAVGHRFMSILTRPDR